MKYLNLILSVMLVVASNTSFAAAPKPEVFRLKIQPKLAKLTADLNHPGFVNIEYAPEGKEEIVDLVLDFNCQVYNGDEHCHAWWSKTLMMDGQKFSYFVYFSNSKSSDSYNAVLTLCLSGEPKAENCGRWISNQIDFKGSVPPKSQVYDSSHWNNSPGSPASYQPILEISPAN